MAKRSTIRIVRLGARGPKAERGRPGGIVAGKPVTTTRNFSTDATGKFFCGIWTSTKGKWAIDYREEEFVYLISGKCRLIDANGRAETFKAGDAFVIPSGFKGFWETLAPLKKYYAIYDSGA
jgi:uncharacterized protein